MTHHNPGVTPRGNAANSDAGQSIELPSNRHTKTPELSEGGLVITVPVSAAWVGPTSSRISTRDFFRASPLKRWAAATKRIAPMALLAVISLFAQRANANYQVYLTLDSQESEASEVQASQNSAPATWTFSSVDPVFTIIPLDDISIPVQVHTSEYVLSDPEKGVFRFRDGKVLSATRVPLDYFATPSNGIRAVRPTLFISIPGASPDGRGVHQWQNKVDFKLSTLLNTQQYVHFTVDWESLTPMQRQADNLADLVKNFLATRNFPWDVVVMGHSRGGIFTHELGQRLAGHPKISKLHLLLLDPNAGTTMGDTYPTLKPAGAYGYLKYDGYPFFILGQFATRGDENITGYENYGDGNFQHTFGANAYESHGAYPENWINATDMNGLAHVLQRIAAAKDNAGASFPVQGFSGKEIIQIRSRDIDANLDAMCSSASCTMDGEVSFGPLGTVSLTGTVGSDGIDAAIATTAAGASVVIRQDQITVTQSSFASQQSARINYSGITVHTTIYAGIGIIQSEMNASSAQIGVQVGRINIPLVSIRPLDAVIPGASLFKKKWKLFKGLF